MLTTSAPALGFAAAHMRTTRAMAAQAQEDLTALAAKGERYEKVDGGYTKAQVDVSVDDSTVDGSNGTLQLTEHTRLYLPSPSRRSRTVLPSTKNCLSPTR
ncbi:hypothetical protein [Streptomyces sp. 900105245]